MVVLFFVRPITVLADATIPRKVSNAFSMGGSMVNMDLNAKIIVNKKAHDKDARQLSFMLLFANT